MATATGYLNRRKLLYPIWDNADLGRWEEAYAEFDGIIEFDKHFFQCPDLDELEASALRHLNRTHRLDTTPRRGKHAKQREYRECAFKNAQKRSRKPIRSLHKGDRIGKLIARNLKAERLFKETIHQWYQDLWERHEDFDGWLTSYPVEKYVWVDEPCEAEESEYIQDFYLQVYINQQDGLDYLEEFYTESEYPWVMCWMDDSELDEWEQWIINFLGLKPRNLEIAS